MEEMVEAWSALRLSGGTDGFVPGQPRPDRGDGPRRARAGRGSAGELRRMEAPSVFGFRFLRAVGAASTRAPNRLAQSGDAEHCTEGVCERTRCRCLQVESLHQPEPQLGAPGHGDCGHGIDACLRRDLGHPFLQSLGPSFEVSPMYFGKRVDLTVRRRRSRPFDDECAKLLAIRGGCEVGLDQVGRCAGRRPGRMADLRDPRRSVLRSPRRAGWPCSRSCHRSTQSS